MWRNKVAKGRVKTLKMYAPVCIALKRQKTIPKSDKFISAEKWDKSTFTSLTHGEKKVYWYGNFHTKEWERVLTDTWGNCACLNQKSFECIFAKRKNSILCIFYVCFRSLYIMRNGKREKRNGYKEWKKQSRHVEHEKIILLFCMLYFSIKIFVKCC